MADGSITSSTNSEEIINSAVSSLVWHNKYLYAGGSLNSEAIITKVDANLNPIWNFVGTGYPIQLLNTD